MFYFCFNMTNTLSKAAPNSFPFHFPLTGRLYKGLLYEYNEDFAFKILCLYLKDLYFSLPVKLLLIFQDVIQVL